MIAGVLHRGGYGDGECTGYRLVVVKAGAGVGNVPSVACKIPKKARDS